MSASRPDLGLVLRIFRLCAQRTVGQASSAHGRGQRMLGVPNLWVEGAVASEVLGSPPCAQSARRLIDRFGVLGVTQLCAQCAQTQNLPRRQSQSRRGVSDLLCLIQWGTIRIRLGRAVLSDSRVGLRALYGTSTLRCRARGR